MQGFEITTYDGTNRSIECIERYYMKTAVSALMITKGDMDVEGKHNSCKLKVKSYK